MSGRMQSHRRFLLIIISVPPYSTRDMLIHKHIDIHTLSHTHKNLVFQLNTASPFGFFIVLASKTVDVLRKTLVNLGQLWLLQLETRLQLPRHISSLNYIALNTFPLCICILKLYVGCVIV